MKILVTLLLSITALFCATYPSFTAEPSAQPITFGAIGHFITPYGPTAQRAPRQGQAAADIPAQIVVDSLYRSSLKDLDNFNYIYVLYYFDKSTHWSPLAYPPNTHDSTGLFATRSPRRPNPIGLGVIELDSINSTTGILYIKGTDAYNGTPVLDIKPYIPQFDSRPAPLNEKARTKIGLHLSTPLKESK